MDSFLPKLALLFGLLLIGFHGHILEYYQKGRQKPTKTQSTAHLQETSAKMPLKAPLVNQKRQGAVPQRVAKGSSLKQLSDQSVIRQPSRQQVEKPDVRQNSPTTGTVDRQVFDQSNIANKLEGLIQDERPVITPPGQSRNQKTNPYDNYVESILNQQKAFFKKCYVRYLKDNIESKGSLLLSFNIIPPGRVSEIAVLGGSLKDAKLHKCTKEVVERVSFRHFAGPPTKVFYPIEFH